VITLLPHHIKHWHFQRRHMLRFKALVAIRKGKNNGKLIASK